LVLRGLRRIFGKYTSISSSSISSSD